MITTPHISACGTVMPFLGVILLFAIRIRASCPPDASSQTTYTTAQYAVSEASAKAARDGTPEALGGQVDLGKLIGSVASILRSHWIQPLFLWSVMSVSQVVPGAYSHLRNILPLRSAGHIRPIGLNHPWRI